MENRYQQIGASYAATRREDPQLKERILASLGRAQTLVNVGAGTGAYEPTDRLVISVEPSRVMIAQRHNQQACVVQARADALPLRDQSVDAAMTVLSLHHWDDAQQRGVQELRRVARGPVIIVTIDASVSGAMWLMKDYLPEVAELDRRIFPSLPQIAHWLGGESHCETLEIARDTPDWTLLSFWAHPERVLDPQARNATSGFARMPLQVIERVVSQVQRDLQSGAWDAQHGELRKRPSYDAGLRLLVNTPSS